MHDAGNELYLEKYCQVVQCYLAEGGTLEAKHAECEQSELHER